MEKDGLKNVVEYFDKFDYYVKPKVQRDICENRTGQFAITFSNSEGKPLENVNVNVRQVSHEFNFGCTVFYLDQFEDDTRNKLYREKFSKIFNYGVVPFYWDTLEPEQGNPRFDENSVKISRRPPIDTAVKFCKENNIRMKGHCLVYNSFQPNWISNDNRELKIQIDNRLRAIAERYGNTFHDFDVINEMITIYKNCYTGNGLRNLQITDEPDHEKWSFDLCKKYFPHSRLFWNEGAFEVFGDNNYKGPRSFYYMTLKDHLSQGTPIEGIGMQFHAYCSRKDTDRIKHLCNPIRHMDVLNCYSDFKLPIHISETSIPSFSNDEDDEIQQAELVKRLYTLWFSQKNVNSVVWWNFADLTAHNTENVYYSGLIRNDCSDKPAYKVLDNLINKEWHTEFSTAVDKRLNFSGFYGDYEIDVIYNGKKTTKKIRLFHDTTGFDNKLCDFRAVNIKID